MPFFERPLPGPAARLLTVTVLAAVLLATGGRDAHAGLGSLTKSAKDKATKTVEKAASPATPGAAPQFDQTTLELTPQRLDQLIACRKAANDAIKDRPKLVERANQIQKELDDLRTKNGDALAANDQKRHETENCRSSAFEVLKQAKIQEAIAHMQANPEMMRKVSELSAQAAQASAAGDTAKMLRLNDELYRAIGISRADTLAIDKKCGVVPPVHPAQIRIDALTQEWNDIMAKIRAMDEQAIKIQKEKCGMTNEQLGMAWDRIQQFLEGKGSFSDAERKALAERKDVLKPLAI